MRRRGFFGALSAGLSFLGIRTASGSAGGPPLVWQQVNEPAEYHHYETSAAGTQQRVEVLKGSYHDWRYEAEILYCHPLAGPYYMFKVEVDWDHADPENSAPLHARSWGPGLEEVRARAEMAIKLFLDVKRLENEAVGPGWSKFRLLSTK